MFIANVNPKRLKLRQERYVAPDGAENSQKLLRGYKHFVPNGTLKMFRSSSPLHTTTTYYCPLPDCLLPTAYCPLTSQFAGLFR